MAFKDTWWTTPINWSSNQLVTAADMNQQVRDNLYALLIGEQEFLKFARVSSDDSSTNTTLQNLNDASFPVGIGEQWTFALLAHITSNTTADIKFDITYPSGTTGVHYVYNSQVPGEQQSIGTPVTVNTGSSDEGIIYAGNIETATTSGTVQVQFAQNSASGTTTVYTDSILFAFRTN